MAWGVHVTGMEQLEAAFDKLPDKARKIAAEALYEGAGVVADAVSKAVQGIATEKFQYAKGGRKRLPSPEEKAILLNSRHGVAKFRKGGVNVQTSVGFDNSGYGVITWNHAKTSASRTKYKMGSNGKMVHASQGTGQSMKPVPLIANAINSGTSFMQKQPFLRKAFSQSKGPANAAIENGLLSRLDQLGLE
jgi:hypothetical protein